MQEQLKSYYNLLSHWNKSIKLASRVGSFDQFVLEHVSDVVHVRPHIKGVSTLLDMGTGAGIPGILIKIEMPEIRVVLLDSIRKKIGFCAAAIRKLELKDISAVVGRAENAEVILSLGRFDVIVSRGTWKLDAYVKLAAPYMKNAGTRVVALKGPDWQQELANAKDILEKNNMKLMAADEYSLEDGRKRCLVVLGNST